MKTIAEIKKKLQKDWNRYFFHTHWMHSEDVFPYRIKLDKPNDKTVLHHFDEVRSWINELSIQFNRQISDSATIKLIDKKINYAMMGKQAIPVAIEFNHVEAVAKYLGKWQQWQLFIKLYQHIIKDFPGLQNWLMGSPAIILKYQEDWPQLLSVCHYIQTHPKPDCYIRQLNLEQVDTKFIERHKQVLKNMLDLILSPSDYYPEYEKLSEHGFEKRYGLRYEQPRVRFRLLDDSVAAEFFNSHGFEIPINDFEMPVEQFSQIKFPEIFCDTVYICENKINGLVFPPLNNTMVIFGLGYGIQILKQVKWLQQCQIYYWGDIDTHGFAILSQARQYFPKIKSWLMDIETLLYCKHLWGEENKKTCPLASLPNLTTHEQEVYQGLKKNQWQQSLRLEQEKIPYQYWINKLI